MRIKQGRLAGAWQDGLRVFKGVPYALPPVGDLRWRPPAPAAAWRGVRTASAFGPSCVQPPYPADSVYFEPARPMAEDCLTLNIWAPKHAAKAPIIVWIHGGALLRGGSASPMYDGGAFAKRGIVFVSINYRLGVFGWLAHPGLSAESPDHRSGNYGLLDQIAALRWVQGNVGAFGGDAANVTVMGESAGALSITYLLASPEARGLFSKAIAESANIRAVPRLHEAVFGMPSAEANGVALADAAGAKDLAGLRSLDAEALVAAATQARFTSQGTVDGTILPAQVVEVFDRGEQAKVPLLIGFNSGEILTQRALLQPIPASAATYEAEVTRRYGDLAPAFLRLYPSADMEASLLAATRDAVFGWTAEHLVQRQEAAGQPGYLYVFDHCYPAARARNLCAFHAAELPFVFDRTGGGAGLGPNWPVPAGPEDQALARQMIDYWVSFATSGAPSGKGRPAWSRYGEGQYYMHFSSVPTLGRDPMPGMLELQDEVVKRRRKSGAQWFTNIGPAAPL